MVEEVRWIKIVTDIFDDEKILLIDGLPERDGIIVIWFKLLCLAGKQNNGGVFKLNDKISYTDEMLATIFHRPLTLVRLALETFVQFGMVEIIEDTVTIPNWGKHQNLEAIESQKQKSRERVAKYREKQKLIASSNGCNADVTQNVTHESVTCNVTRNADVTQNVTHESVTCNVTRNADVTQCNAIEREGDIEKEIDIEIERGRDGNKEEPPAADPPPSPKKEKPSFHTYGEYKHVRLTDEQYKKLVSDFGETITADYIKRCDEYIQQTGKKYKDHNLTIRKWIDKDEPKPKDRGNSSFDAEMIEKLTFDKYKNL